MARRPIRQRKLRDGANSMVQKVDFFSLNKPLTLMHDNRKFWPWYFENVEDALVFKLVWGYK